MHSFTISPRQGELLRFLLGRSMPEGELALAMGIDPRSARRHREALRKKGLLDGDNRPVAYVYRFCDHGSERSCNGHCKDVDVTARGTLSERLNKKVKVYEGNTRGRPKRALPPPPKHFLQKYEDLRLKSDPSYRMSKGDVANLACIANKFRLAMIREPEWAHFLTWAFDNWANTGKRKGIGFVPTSVLAKGFFLDKWMSEHATVSAFSLQKIMEHISTSRPDLHEAIGDKMKYALVGRYARRILDGGEVKDSGHPVIEIAKIVAASPWEFLSDD